MAFIDLPIGTEEYRKVFLNDHELKGVTSINIDLEPKALPVVTIEISLYTKRITLCDGDIHIREDETP